MAFKHEQLPDWLATHAPGQRLVAYVVTSSRAVSNLTPDLSPSGRGSTHGDRQSDAVAESLGLDTRIRSAHDETFWALTDRELLLGTRSAVRNRPKELLHRAEIDQVTVYWSDGDYAKNRFRFFLTDFGDGTGRSDRAGLTMLGRTVTSSNAEPYVHALGDRAHHIDPETFTTPTARTKPAGTRPAPALLP